MPSVDNPIGALQELSQARGGQPAPVYVLQDVCGESHCPHFTYEASWADLRAVGEGSSKVRLQLSGCSQNIQLQKEAKKCAAQKLLTLVSNSEHVTEGTEGTEGQEEESKTDGVTPHQDGDAGLKYYRGNKVGELQEHLMARGLGVVSYTDGKTTGPPHKQHFTIIATVGNITETGEGKTKKEAKVNMRWTLKETVNVEKSVVFSSKWGRRDPLVRSNSCKSAQVHKFPPWGETVSDYTPTVRQSQ